MESCDLVYLIRMFSAGVLRKVEGHFRHVGVCYIPGVSSGTKRLRVVKGRECDVREANIV